MAFMQYLKMEGVSLPLPDSYDLNLTDVEADSGGETEAGTTQRDGRSEEHTSELQSQSSVY